MLPPPPRSTLFPYTTLFRSTRLRHLWVGHRRPAPSHDSRRSEEHTSELQSLAYLVCRLLLEKKKDIVLINFDDMSLTKRVHIEFELLAAKVAFIDQFRRVHF